ncbi:class I SAM-dependent methyltransferase [Dermacoccus sp. Tok2021]|uniref:class I SAM-dependent methyltransferase n=1 Tax=Dermacoccus sp. Tok2021 TaxID=2826873 RepID=UPI001CA64360|nr:class I SAM-dependent methyltransferase [Dermacoccus sp. Tok2021]MBZ4497760.1 class I SAM-dependent methyltransferase [Dermacoccus sp. Tok2021]
MSGDASTVYTHGHSEPVLRSHSWRTVENSAAYLAPHLTPGARLLDVGAGPGTISIDFARRVKHVTVTEISDDALSHSRQAASTAGVTNMSFAVEDVLDLSFPDDSFDVVHAHQVLQHVADPAVSLREMARVTRPGGVVAVRDADYGAMTWWPESADMQRWRELYSAAARANRGEPDAGRRLFAWAHAAGLVDATASSSTWTYAASDERLWWAELWADRVTHTFLAEQLVADGSAARPELEDIATAWRRWGEHPDGWFCVPHGEILWRKP